MSFQKKPIRNFVRSGCLVGLFSGVFVLALITTAVAEPAYSWVGADGRTYFGSKPAKNAKSVKKLNTKPLSRYSTDKMLKRLGWDEQRREAQGAVRNEAGTQLGSLGTPEPEVSDADATTELEHDEVQISTTAEGAIASCSVSIKNNSATPYSGISVAFELIDGTLVPGEGPDSLGASASAEYVMPADLLPLTLEPAKDRGEADPLVSKVLIHANPVK